MQRPTEAEMQGKMATELALLDLQNVFDQSRAFDPEFALAAHALTDRFGGETIEESRRYHWTLLGVCLAGLAAIRDVERLSSNQEGHSDE